jgi:autotransporter-associated beta strand protein
MPAPLVRLLRLLLVAVFAGAVALHAQRQMEPLGRGVVAMRTSSTQVYVGWRLLGSDPADLGFNLYRSIGGAAATKLNGSVLTASTNYLDTPGATALASVISYHVVPVRNGVEQTASAAYTLAANATSGRQFIRLPFASAYPNPASTFPYTVKFCWVGDFDGDGEYDFLVDRLSTNPTAEKQFLEAYKRDGTFLWRMDMGVNSVNQYAYEPGSSAISIGDTDNVTVYDLDGDGRAEVAVRTANGVTVTNAAGTVVATISAASNTTQFVSIINGLTGAELARATLPNPWAQFGTLTSKCAVGYFDGQRPSVLFYGYNRDGSGPFYRAFTAFDYRNGQLTQRWSTAQTFHGAEGHQIRIADVDNDGKDEVCEIGHVIDDNGTQLFDIAEVTHGDRFHVADIDPDRPGLENFIIQQNNPSFLATAYYDAGTGQMLKKWYATDVVDVGRGIAQDLNSTHKGYEMYSTQPGIYNAKGIQIYTNNVWAPEGLWWDTDLLREFIDGAGSGALNPVINKFNQTTGVSDRLWTIYSDAGSFSITQAYGGRPAFWGDLLGDWREELVFVTTDYTALRIYTPTSVATNRLYTLMHNPAYRCQTTTKGYVQSSNVDYYLGVGMTTPPPPPMVPAALAWAGGAGASTWNTGTTSAWKNTATSAASTFSAGQSVRFDLAGNNSAAVALSGMLQPGDVTVYSPIDYTFDGAAGSLAGTMKLVKAGKGALRVTGAHAFSGATTVWDGALRVDGTLSATPVTVWGGTWGGPLAKGLTGGRLAGSGTINQAVAVQYRGTLTPGTGMNSAGTLTLGGGLTAADGATLAFDLSTDPSGLVTPNDRLAITGNLALSGVVSVVINPLSGQLASGTYTLATYSGSLTGSTSNLSVVVPEGTPYSVSLASGALTLTVPVTRPAGAVTWAGTTSGTWDISTTQNWRLSGSPAVFVTGDTVAFDDTGSTRPAVTLNVSAPLAGLTFAGSTNYTLSGSGSIAGAGGLAKSGASIVTVNTTNSFTGPVAITGGVLAIDNLADGGAPSSIGASPAAAANFTLNGGTLRLVGPQTNTNRGLTLGASGGAIEIPTASVNLQISGGITGAGALTKTGAGTLILAAANTHTGGTVLQAGTLVLASDTANTSGLGSGGITLQGGTLRMYDNIGSSNTSSWPINVPAGASARFEADGRSALAGALTGAGTLDFNTSYVRTDLTGNWSAFTGTLNVTTDADGGDLRLMQSAGLPGALLNVAASTYTYYNNTLSSNFTYPIGALAGSGTLAGTITGGRTLTWQIGARGTDTTFAGVFANGTGTTALTKVGAGTLTLTGASTHTGATTVSAGKLVLSGGSLTGSAVTVQSGGTFGGNGAVTGNLTFNSGATLLAHPTAPLAITGNLAFGGAVTVSPAPGATFTAGTYTLCTYSGTLTGTPTFAWSGTGFTATFSTATAGQIRLTLAPSPATVFTTFLTTEGVPADQRTVTADPDFDGVANLLEFALGGKPMLADATASLPTVSANASTLSLTYKRVRPVEIIYSVQTTTDLAGTPVWTPEGVNQGTPAGDGTTTATVPLSTDRRFLRLGVSLAP